MNVYIDKVQGTFLSLLFSFHQTEEGMQHLRVCSATPPTQIYGFTRWEKQGFLCSITETVQMHECQVIVAKGTLLKGKNEKEMLPRWCGQMKPALLSSAQPQRSSHSMWFSAQARKPCSNLLPMQFYSFYTGVGSQLCIKTAECCARDLPGGAALVHQLQHCKEMQQHQCLGAQVGCEVIHGHDESGARAA